MDKGVDYMTHSSPQYTKVSVGMMGRQQSWRSEWILVMLLFALFVLWLIFLFAFFFIFIFIFYYLFFIPLGWGHDKGERQMLRDWEMSGLGLHDVKLTKNQ